MGTSNCTCNMIFPEVGTARNFLMFKPFETLYSSPKSIEDGRIIFLKSTNIRYVSFLAYFLYLKEN
jgi:hypothetical protein